MISDSSIAILIISGLYCYGQCCYVTKIQRNFLNLGEKVCIACVRSFSIKYKFIIVMASLQRLPIGTIGKNILPLYVDLI